MLHLNNLAANSVNNRISQFIVYAVILLCVLVYIQFYRFGDAGISLWYLPLNWQQLSESGYYWQLISPIFIHFTEWHLLSNLILWWYLARIIGQVSAGGLLLLCLSTAVVSNLAEWSVSHSLIGGLSGVVAGLVGFLAGYQWLRPNGIFFIQWTFVASFVAYLVVVATGAFGVYSNAAHFMGLAWGILSAVVIIRVNQHKNTVPLN